MCAGGGMVNQVLLDGRDFGIINFNAHIAAGNHNAIGNAQDLINIINALDVYKRQPLWKRSLPAAIAAVLPVWTRKPVRSGISRLTLRWKICRRQRDVSYTHLDVYKRQGQLNRKT